MWRNYTLSLIKIENAYLLGEDSDIKLYGEFELKRLKILFEWQIDLQPELREHLKEIRARCLGVEIGDKRVTSKLDQQHMGGSDDEFAIDEVGILNLQNMMEVWVFSKYLCENRILFSVFVFSSPWK